MHAAATGKHARGRRLLAPEGVGDRPGGQLQQRRLHVARILAPQPRLQPLQVELLPAGAAWGRQREPRLFQQAFQ